MATDCFEPLVPILPFEDVKEILPVVAVSSPELLVTVAFPVVIEPVNLMAGSAAPDTLMVMLPDVALSVPPLSPSTVALPVVILPVPVRVPAAVIEMLPEVAVSLAPELVVLTSCVETAAFTMTLPVVSVASTSMDPAVTSAPNVTTFAESISSAPVKVKTPFTFTASSPVPPSIVRIPPGASSIIIVSLPLLALTVKFSIVA